MEQLPLVAGLNAVLSSTDDLMVTILIDGSTSVAPHWAEVQGITLSLAHKLVNIDVQVIQFAATARTEIPFSRDSVLVESTIKTMKIMGGSTNMAAGFQLTRESLYRSLTSTSAPVIFFVTDGEYTGDHPGKEITELLKLDPAPKVIGIGVGAGVNVDHLRALLPGQQVFHTNAYSLLDTAVKELTVKPKKSDPAIKLEFIPSTTVQKSREDLVLQFMCEPDMPLDVLPYGTKIHFLSNNFFYAEIVTLHERAERHKPVKESVTLKIKPQAKLQGEFPEKIWYEVTIPGQQIYRGYIQMLLGWLSGDFIYQRSPNRPINFLLWGPMGSGKSSFINGIATLFSSGQNVVSRVKAYPNTTHVTKDYTCIPVSSVLDDSPLGNALKDKLKINFWDPWGLTSDGYKNLSLIHFLEGRVRPNTRMNDDPCNAPVDPDCLIHEVIFIIPIGTSQDSVMLDTLSKNIVTALEFDICPKIIVNYINTVKSEAEIKNALETIRKASHLAAKHLFVLDNYNEEKCRNMDKDLQYWKILQGAFEEAIKKLEKDPTPSSYKSTQSGGVTTPTNRPLCQTTGCDNLNKEVTTPCCPLCGSVPVLDVALCATYTCSAYMKPVTTPRCGQCGNVPHHNVQAKERVCQTQGCKNANKLVTTPRCPNCGSDPDAKSKSNEHPADVPTARGITHNAPAPNPTRATSDLSEGVANISLSNKVPRCPSTSCINYKCEVPDKFDVCPFCQQRPALA